MLNNGSDKQYVMCVKGLKMDANQSIKKQYVLWFL